jgi:hypothetical protein
MLITVFFPPSNFLIFNDGVDIRPKDIILPMKALKFSLKYHRMSNYLEVLQSGHANVVAGSKY